MEVRFDQFRELLERRELKELKEYNQRVLQLLNIEGD